MSGTSDDGYRRGRQAEAERSPRVRSVYRKLLLVIWTLGTVIALAVGGANFTGAFTVVVVMHIFFAGIIWADIRALRKQGVEWGLSRHLWFSSALVFPLVTLLYCWYVRRVVRRENGRRGYPAEPSAAAPDSSADEPSEMTGSSDGPSETAGDGGDDGESSRADPRT